MSRRNRNAGPRVRAQSLYIEVDFTTGKKCGKRKFETYSDAELVLGLALGRKLRGDHKRNERRIYLCDWCGGFHLTSQEWNRDTPVKTR